jgi:hypothetical protein
VETVETVEEVSGCLFVATVSRIQIHADIMEVEVDVEVHVEVRVDVCV